jgi:hypothetical protein
VAWDEAIRAPLATLRERSDGDCWLRAWLQFGRAPALTPSEISDLRFESGARQNFTTLQLQPAGAPRGCPPYMTSWAMPRADLLQRSP